MTSHISPARLPGFLKILVLMLLTLTLAGLPFASVAQDTSSSASSAQPAAPDTPPPPPSPDTVIATVGGQPITQGDLGFVHDDLGQDANNVPPDQMEAVLLSQMIDLKLMAEAGHAQKIEDGALYKYLADRALRRAFIETAVAQSVTSDEIKAAYDKAIAAIPDQDEVHARHILVSKDDEAGAKAIKAQLDAGADFATLAKEKSIDPSGAQSGGDLGYFTQDKMVKEFADVAFALKVGEISQPVLSQFGWHIIQVLDRRKAEKPTLDSMSQQLGQQIYVDKYRALFSQLRGAATIDIPDAALKAAVDAQLGPMK